MLRNVTMMWEVRKMQSTDAGMLDNRYEDYMNNYVQLMIILAMVTKQILNEKMNI